MEQTSKDYFIRKVERQNKQNKKIERDIVADSILGIVCVASAAYVASTETYPLDSLLLERLCPVIGIVGAAGSFYSVKNALEKKNSKVKRNTQTPEQKAKTYTKNLQREIVF